METHVPVMVEEALESMAIEPGDTVLDATVGTGGHARSILRAMRNGIFVGIDADGEALAKAKQALEPDLGDNTAHFVEDNFRNIKTIADGLGIRNIKRMLVDLGWGSHQIAGGRGFSFMHDEPIGMCYGTKEGACPVSAIEIINTFREDDLQFILRTYGEERWARRIAKQIVRERKAKPIVTTGHLATIVKDAIPKQWHPKRIHPATKTFQAIRITVNDEINALEEFLAAAKGLAESEARVTAIAFHSLEDRAVKQTFKKWEQEDSGRRREKKPTRPSEEECARNPRARSAKIRSFIFK